MTMPSNVFEFEKENLTNIDSNLFNFVEQPVLRVFVFSVKRILEQFFNDVTTKSKTFF